MLARSRAVTIAGVDLDTPLLVPSVSSRGFPIADGISEASQLLHLAENDLTTALLVSAYDLFHGHLDMAESFLQGARETALDRSRLLVVDSGGYETGHAWESGHADRTELVTFAWTLTQYAEVLDRLPRDRPVLAVSYDGPGADLGSYVEQIDRANDFFDMRPHLAACMLLKPREGNFIDSDEIIEVAARMTQFDVVGVTEKELAETVPGRLRALTRLRIGLDRAGVQAPLHLFGALDPVLTPLYVAAGAEVVDGLSWLRYRFLGGMAVHPEAAAVLDGSCADTPLDRDARRVIANLAVLAELQQRLQRFGPPSDEGFAALEFNRQTLAETYRTACRDVDESATGCVGHEER